MKVALLHYAAQPVIGGVETVIGHQARLLADHGYQVRILAGRGAQVDPRVPFVHLPLVDSRHPEVLAVKAELDAGRIPAAFKQLSARLEGILEEALQDVDIVIAHNVCSLHKNLPLTASLKNLYRRPGAPRLILWHHDLAWTSERYRDELHEGYPWNLLRTDWPGAVQVVVSRLRQHELAKLLEVTPERIHIVPNGIDAGHFLKLEAKTQELVNQLDLLVAAPFLLLPVRITQRKNIELALRCLAALRLKLPHAILLITGPLGPHNPDNRAYFERLLALRDELGLRRAAHFLAELSGEFLPDAVIADFYHLADGLFLPSREEGFGIPILEAGLAGIPVFCADIPSLRELGDDHACYFSPDADPGEVAALIENRLSSDSAFGLRFQVRTAYAWERVFSERIEPLLR